MEGPESGLENPKMVKLVREGNSSPGTLSSRSSTPTRKSVARKEKLRQTTRTKSAQSGRGYNKEVAAEDSDYLFGSDFEDVGSDNAGENESNTSYHSDLSVSDAESECDMDIDGSFAAQTRDDISDGESSDSSSVGGPQRGPYQSQRPASPVPVWLREDKDVSVLELPKSSEDLLVPREFVMQTLCVYEALMHFRTLCRISPFRIEDFCAALEYPSDNSLLREVHISLLKALLREEEAQHVHFGAVDQRDSINADIYFMDSLTWPAVLKGYMESDKKFKEVCDLLKPDYPSAPLEVRLQVLQFLVNEFMITGQAREFLQNEGTYIHEDHCRVCHRLGDLLCCETCSGVYHLQCMDPPLEDVPDEDWQCQICKAHLVPGVKECIPDFERVLTRKEALGYDRHGRKYWFLCRRLLIETEDGEVWYYSTEAQFNEVLSRLDPQEYEHGLFQEMDALRERAGEQMLLTYELTEKHKPSGVKVTALQMDIDDVNQVRQDSADGEGHKDSDDMQGRGIDFPDESSLPTQKEEVVIEESIGMEVPQVISQETLGNADSRANTDKKAAESDTSNTPGGIVTRSKTGSLQPMRYSLNDLNLRTYSRSHAEGNQHSFKFSGAYKLGMEGNFKKYENQYSTNPLALSKPQHQEEREKRRHLSHKFSMAQAGDFKWPSAHNVGDEMELVLSIRQALINLQTNIPASFLHHNWYAISNQWLSLVRTCNDSRGFAKALTILAQCIRPIAYTGIWNEGMGHTRWHRLTAGAREFRKKQEKREQKERELEEERCRYTGIFVKYTLGLKHQVFKQKGEEYRVHGQWGWQWMSATWTHRPKNCHELGLRAGPQRYVVEVKTQDKISLLPVDPSCYQLLLNRKMEEKITAPRSSASSEMPKREEEEDEGVALDMEEDFSSSKTTLHPDVSQQPDTLFPDIGNPDLIDVSEGLAASGARRVYPKLAARSKVLDSFLSRRLSMAKLEDAVMAKHEGIIDASQLKTEVHKEDKDGPALKTEESEDRIVLYTTDPLMAEIFALYDTQPYECARRMIEVGKAYDSMNNLTKLYPCYSPSCNADEGKVCYSTYCRRRKELAGRYLEMRKIFQLVKDKKMRQVVLDSTGAGKQPPLPSPKAESVPTLNEENRIDTTPSTKGKVYLKKVEASDMGGKKPLVKYPLTSSFRTRGSKKYSIMILPQYELRKLARRGGKEQVTGFNYNAKVIQAVWPYPCPRPIFKTCWLYRLAVTKSLHEASLLARILWASLKWDDMQMRLPSLDTKHQVTTDTEIVTTEVLDKKMEGRFEEDYKYLVRRVVIPLDLPKTVREVAPSRSGLRKRKRAESPLTAEPRVVEEWVGEDHLELWQIKQFHARKERSTPTPVLKGKEVKDNNGKGMPDLSNARLSISRSVEDLKEKLEEQLKLQRAAQKQRIILSDKGAFSSPQLFEHVTTVSTDGRKYTRISIPRNLMTGKTLLNDGKVQMIQGADGKVVAHIASPAASQIAPSQIIQIGDKRILLTPGATALGKNALAGLANLAVAKGGYVVGTQQMKSAVAVSQTPPVTPNKIEVTRMADGSLQVRGLQPGQQLVELPDGKFQLVTTTTTTTPSLASKGRKLVPQITSVQGGVGFMATQTKTADTQPPPAQSTNSSVLPSATVINTDSGPRVILQGTNMNSLTPQQTATLQTYLQKAIQTAQATNQPVQIPLSNRSQEQAPVQQQPQQSLLVSSSPKVRASTGMMEEQSSMGEFSDDSFGTVRSPSQKSKSKFVVTPSFLKQTIQTALKSGNLSKEVEMRLEEFQKLHERGKMDAGLSLDLDYALPSSPMGVDTFPGRGGSSKKKGTSGQSSSRSADSDRAVPKSRSRKDNSRSRSRVSETPMSSSSPLAFEEPRKTKEELLLHKHTQFLRREMIKKRTHLEKVMEIDLQREKLENDAETSLRYESPSPPPQPPPKRRRRSSGSEADLSPPRMKSSKKSPHVRTSSSPSGSASGSKKRKLATGSTVVLAPPLKKDREKLPTCQKLLPGQKLLTGPPMNKKNANKIYCICRTPYDPSKFYVGCDVCSNWFHGLCVGVTEKASRNMTEFLCPECRHAKETAELYCLCREPYDESKFYICCDECSDWFHGGCVGVLPIEGDTIDQYYCPTCQPNSSRNRANMSPLTPAGYEALKSVFYIIKSHKHAWPFLEPVDPQEVPNYYHVVKDPMDMKTVESRLQAKEYVNLKEFLGDMIKIFNNCRLFHPPESALSQCANTLESFLAAKLKALRPKLAAESIQQGPPLIASGRK